MGNKEVDERVEWGSLKPFDEGERNPGVTFEEMKEMFESKSPGAIFVLMSGGREEIDVARYSGSIEESSEPVKDIDGDLVGKQLNIDVDRVRCLTSEITDTSMQEKPEKYPALYLRYYELEGWVYHVGFSLKEAEEYIDQYFFDSDELKRKLNEIWDSF